MCELHFLYCSFFSHVLVILGTQVQIIKAIRMIRSIVACLLFVIPFLLIIIYLWINDKSTGTFNIEPLKYVGKGFSKISGEKILW